MDLELLQGKPLMPPLWLAYPTICRYSIGWRMGAGEDYAFRFYDWFEQLTKEEQDEYAALFPAPKRWVGYYEEDDDLTERYYYQMSDRPLWLWQEDGKPAYARPQLVQDAADGRVGERDYLFFWRPQPAADGSTAKSCFSQWWPSNFVESIERYSCMEQYMMAAKASLFGDKEIREEIMNCMDPKTIKDLGRKVRGFDEKTWDNYKYSIVLNGNYLKFSQNEELRRFLLETGDQILVEASPYDRIWGIRLGEHDPNARHPEHWRGQNLLGFALMEVREEIRRVYQNEGLLDFKFVE